ncbi:jg19888, partial [Pararge aegeria aegeria]
CRAGSPNYGLGPSGGDGKLGILSRGPHQARHTRVAAWAGMSTASIIQLATKSSHLKGTGSVPLVDRGSVPLVTKETDEAFGRLRSNKTAPGPDGIPGRVIYMTREILEARLRELFNRCLLAGPFPKSWKDR